MNSDTKPAQAILSLVKLGRNDEWHLKSGIPKITKLLPNKDSITIGCPNGGHQPDVCMKSISKKIKISPHHAVVQREPDGGFTIIDKSKFGTYLNYVRVKGRMRLENGDIICFGCAKGFRIRPGKEIDKKSSDLKYMVVIEDKFPRGQTDEEMKMRFDQLVKSTSDIKERIDTLENLTKKFTTFCL